MMRVEGEYKIILDMFEAEMLKEYIDKSLAQKKIDPDNICLTIAAGVARRIPVVSDDSTTREDK